MANEKKIVLVTGATGFIGTWLCTTLARNGYHVRTLLRPSSAASSLPNDVELELYRAELEDQDGLARACTNVDLVFHAAGIAHVAYPSVARLQKVIVDGTRSLANVSKQQGVKKFVLVSSVLAAEAEQGDSESLSTYGQCKKAAEENKETMFADAHRESAGEERIPESHQCR